MKQSNKLWITSYRRRKPIGKYADDYTLETAGGQKTLRYSGTVYCWDVSHSRRRACCGGLAVLICVSSVLPGVIPSALGAMLLVNLLYGLSQAALVLLLYRLIAVLLLGDRLERIDYERKVKQCNYAVLLFAVIMSCTVLLAAAELCALSGRISRQSVIYLGCTAASALLGWIQWRCLKRYSLQIKTK